MILLIFSTSLSAQISRNEADEIVKKYLENKVAQVYPFYIKTDVTGDFTLTTSNRETFRVKYDCWIYLKSESAFSKTRYLFVNKDNGCLTEIVANNDAGPDDLSSWKVVDTFSGIEEIENRDTFPYPNPVEDWLTIPFCESNKRIEIYDLTGTCYLSEILSDKDACLINVSFLKAGVYFLNISGKTHKIMKK